MKAKKKGLSLWLDSVTYRDYGLDDQASAMSDAVQQYRRSVAARGDKLFRNPVPDPQPTIHGTLDVIVRALLVRKQGAADVRKATRLPHRAGRDIRKQQKAQQHLFRDETRR